MEKYRLENDGYVEISYNFQSFIVQKVEFFHYLI